MIGVGAAVGSRGNVIFKIQILYSLLAHTVDFHPHIWDSLLSSRTPVNFIIQSTHLLETPALTSKPTGL